MRISSGLNRLRSQLYGLWFATVFGCAATILVLLIVVTPDQQRRRRMTRTAARAVFRLTDSWPQIDGLDNLPEQAAVAVANHASYLDGILLIAVLPHRYHFVIKREITRVPIAHFLLRRIGAHFVERHDVQRGASDARRIFQTAADGGSLAIFPEGTFTAEPGLQRFRNGAFVIAARARLPLVPVAICGTRKMLPANRWLPTPGRLTVIIHEPLPAAAGGEMAAAMESCRQRILQSLMEPDLLALANSREPEKPPLLG